MRTLQEHKERSYYWMRRWLDAGNYMYGMHRDSPRTKQLGRIAKKAQALFLKAQEHRINRLLTEYAATLDSKAYKRLERAYLKQRKHWTEAYALERAIEECGLNGILEVWR